MYRAASISTQLTGVHRRINSSWNVISKSETVGTKIAFNNFNKSYDIYVNNNYLNLKSDWRIGHPLVSVLIENKLFYFTIQRNGPIYKFNHKGTEVELKVLTDRHTELNKLMIPRKDEDKSKFLLSPMPGLLTSILVKEKDKVEENQPLAIIEAMKMENIIKAEKASKVKKINCSNGDSLEVDQVILEFE